MRCKYCKSTFRKTHRSHICGYCRRGIINPKFIKQNYTMTEEIKNPVKLLTGEDEKWKEKYIERQLQSSCRRKSVTVDGSIYRVMKAISFLRGQPLGETYSIAVYEWASKRYPELIKDVQAQFQEDLEKSIQQESE